MLRTALFYYNNRMSHLEILILAIALSIDACIVSFTCSLKSQREHIKNSLMLSACTGLFQALMPIFGYYLTNFVKVYIEPYSKFIVFIIFTYLGIKFILESNEKKESKTNLINAKTLILIGIATSIDAFSAGISLSLFGINSRNFNRINHLYKFQPRVFCRVKIKEITI